MNVARHPFIYKTSREALYKAIGITSRLPPDFKQVLKYVVIGTIGGEPLTAAVFVVTHEMAVRWSKSKAGKAHRVWVHCPACTKLQPLSRIHQHYGSEKCKPGLGASLQAERDQRRKETV